MSIATEIQRLQNAKADIKVAIENKGVEVGDGRIDTYAEKINNLPSTDEAYANGYNEGYENGKNSVIDFGRYASTVRFSSSDWAKEETVLNLDRATAINQLWYGFTDYTVKHLTVNCLEPIIYMNRAFYLAADNYLYPNSMEHITINADTSQCSTFEQAFGYMYNLKVIDGTPLDLSSSSNNKMFLGVSNLEEVRFAKETIKINSTLNSSQKLSLESLLSILHGLKDYSEDTSGGTRTLTLGTTNLEKLTDEQKAIATEKGWTLA
jgi:hypothetical protein